MGKAGIILGGNGKFSSKCNFISALFCGEKLKDVLCLAECCLFLAETDYPLPCATLYLRFSESKRRAKDFRGSNAAAKADYTCVWLTSDYFELKRVIFFKVQLYICTFRRRKVPCEDKWSKSRSRDYSPLDNPLTGGFCPKL